MVAMISHAMSFLIRPLYRDPAFNWPPECDVVWSTLKSRYISMCQIAGGPRQSTRSCKIGVLMDGRKLLSDVIFTYLHCK